MRPLILITNDDGIHSPGLRAAVEAVAELGDILVVAPYQQQTTMARSFPRIEGLGMLERVTDFDDLGAQVQGWSLHGSPGFCVAHGVLELADRKPDLCVAGINYGENLGQTVTCSGTMGAAFEAYSHHVPAVAVSLETDPATYRMNEFARQDWTSAQRSLYLWAQWMLAQGTACPAELLNINVPAIPLLPEQYRITTVSRQNYLCFCKPERRQLDKPFELKCELRIDRETLEPDSDIQAVAIDRITSVTPIQAVLSTGWRTGAAVFLPGDK